MGFANGGEVVETSPTTTTTTTTLQPGFSFGVAFEALHSRLALELRKKCTKMALKNGDPSEVVAVVGELAEEVVPVMSNDRYVALHTQINEVQREAEQWRRTMGEMMVGYERRKSDELARLREEWETQALVARRQADQAVERVQTLHAAKVQELYDLFLHVHQDQPITEEFLASIQTRANRQLQEIVESQQQEIQELQAASFISHLKTQSLEAEAATLKLALLEKEDVLASLKSELEELIPKLHGYIDAREHLLTMTLKEKTGEDFHKLELLLRNEQRENAWMQRALKENKRKRADRLSRLQQQVTDLTATVAEKDDIISMLERGFHLTTLKDAFPQWLPETTIC